MGIITNAGLAYISRQQANSQPVQMSHFILAYIPDLDIMSTPDPDSGLPDQALIRGQYPITREGYNNQDSITYTLELDSSVGDFDFNWYAVITDSNEVAAINFIYAVFKRAGIQQIVTRNFVMNYARAQEATGITIPAQTWQFDYTSQMKSVESDIAAVIEDLAQTKENLNNRFLEQGNQLIDHTQQLESHSQELDGHTQQLQDHVQQLQSHTQQHNDNSELLQSHAQLHTNHGQRLNSHDTTLGQHNTAIDTNRNSINGHTTLLGQHTRQISGQSTLLTNHESRIQQNESNAARITQNEQAFTQINSRINSLQYSAVVPLSSTTFNSVLRFPTPNKTSMFRLTIATMSTSPEYSFTGIFDISLSLNGERQINPILTRGVGELGMTLHANDDATGYLSLKPDNIRGGVTIINAEINIIPYAGDLSLYFGSRQPTRFGFSSAYDRTGQIDG